MIVMSVVTVRVSVVGGGVSTIVAAVSRARGAAVAGSVGSVIAVT